VAAYHLGDRSAVLANRALAEAGELLRRSTTDDGGLPLGVGQVIARWQIWLRDTVCRRIVPSSRSSSTVTASPASLRRRADRPEVMPADTKPNRRAMRLRACHPQRDHG
jgi:hypothetical protein